MYTTQTDLFKFITNENAPMGLGSIIKNIIDDDLKSDGKIAMVDGIKYYNNSNDIVDRVITYYIDGSEVIDGSASNNKLSHNYHKIIVDQKVAYVVGNPIVFETEDEKLGQVLEAELGDYFNDIISQLVKGAANKGVDYLHVYFDSEGNLSYVIVPAEQIIPIYDTQFDSKLVSVLRYYPFEFVKPDGNKETRYKVEWWTGQNVTYYTQGADGEYMLDPDKSPNPRAHWYKYNDTEPDKKTGQSWGRVPFIMLKNNDEMTPDLNQYKSLIDDYDLQTSDASNNLADIQDLVWILKGYEGTSLSEFMRNLKVHKAINIAPEEHAGATAEAADIPTEAREKHLERLDEDIFTFGMALNIKTDKFGNSPSGIALKFLFTLLDLKSSTLIRKMKAMLKDFLWFMVTGINERDGSAYSPDGITYTFNKSLIINEAEKIESAMKSKGIISDETIAANHPWVDNVQDELDNLEKSKNELTLNAE